MKRYRSALMAGLLALAVAVCDDGDGTVTQPPVVNVAPPNVEVNIPPTPPTPPTVVPLTAMITPPAAVVGVDGMVDFAVGTSGGTGDASWTCTSSDTAVATAETTDTGCRATAVAGGGATITAAVTKGSETTNIAAQLTVSTTTDAFIIVTNISGDPDPAMDGGGPTGADGLKGSVDVQIRVDRGNQTFEKLSLNVDGMEVASRDFGTAAAAEDAEQSALPFTLSFDSDGYDYETGAVDFMNGEHSIQALLKIAGRDEALMSGAVPVEFNNDNFLKASMNGLGDGAANESTGQMWYGGPGVMPEISAMPVVFSSGGVSSVTLKTFCGADAMTDSEAPFMFEVDCDGYTTMDTDKGDKPVFTVGGDDIDVKASAVYLDFKAPEAPDFQPNPNKREQGWVNAMVGFTAEWEDKKGKKDGWLVYKDEDDDNPASNGVGGYTPQLRIAEAGDDKEVGGALAAPALMEVPAAALAALAGQSSEGDAYCVVVSAVDRLGNESELPDADADCVTAEVYGEATEDTPPAGLLAGVDLQEPTISFSAASPSRPTSAPRLSATQEFQLQVSDPGSNASGIREESAPVIVEASRRNAKKTTEIEIEAADLDVSLPLVTTDIVDAENQAYYTVEAETFDKAGNRSEKIMRTAVLDTGLPVTGTIIGAYDKKKGLYPVTATVTDNLSIKAYWAEMRFTGSPGGLTIENHLFLPQEGGTAVDAFNAPTLSTNALAPIMVRTYQAIQTAGAITNLASIGVFARDHGNNTPVGAFGDGGTSAVAFSPALALAIADGFDIEADEIAPGTMDEPGEASASDMQVFQALMATTKVKSGTVTLTATASGTLFTAPRPPTAAADDPATTDFNESAGAAGTQGLMNNPFTRVDFYAAVALDDGAADGEGRAALKYIGSVPGAAAGAEDFDADPPNDPAANNSRRFIYSMEMSDAAFLEIVGGDNDYGIADTDAADTDTVATEEGAIIAIGVRKDNQAVGFSSAATDLHVED